MPDTVEKMKPGDRMLVKRWALWVVPSRGEAWLNPRYSTQYPDYVHADRDRILVLMTEDGAEVSMTPGLRVPHVEFNPWRGPKVGYYVNDLIPVTLLDGRQMASTRATQRLSVARVNPPSWLPRMLSEVWWNPDT